jgi:hypothetical protein
LAEGHWCPIKEVQKSEPLSSCLLLGGKVEREGNNTKLKNRTGSTHFFFFFFFFRLNVVLR